MAMEHGVRTIAFPAISTGVYGYPIDEACGIAVTAVKAYLSEADAPIEVIFCCFSNRDLFAYNMCGVPTSEAL